MTTLHAAVKFSVFTVILSHFSCGCCIATFVLCHSSHGFLYACSGRQAKRQADGAAGAEGRHGRKKRSSGARSKRESLDAGGRSLLHVSANHLWLCTHFKHDTAIYIEAVTLEGLEGHSII